jgi:alpha-1,3-rhamnosyl/mannosyltransferase
MGSQLPPEFRAPSLEVIQVEAAMIDEHFEQLGLPAVLEEICADCYVNTTFSVPALKTTRWQMAYVHDVVFEDHPEWVEEGLRSYLKRWAHFAAHQADRIITVSQHACGRIAEVYGIPAGKIGIIPNGLPATAYSRPDDGTIDRARHKHNLTTPYIMYIGSLEPKKGVLEFVNAYISCSDLRTHYHIVIIGASCPSLLDIKQLIAATGVPERIHCLGYLPEDEKRALLAGSALFVYPSHYEGFGLPPLEALALGIPCVVNDATSLPEVVGDLALKCDVHDAVRFAETLRRGLGDGGYRATAQKRGPCWARRFTWARAADMFLDQCESLRE